MKTSGLKRLIPVGWKRAARELVDHMAARHVFEASEVQRAEIASRADTFVSSSRLDDETASDLKFDLFVGDWNSRAKASARLSSHGAWTPWYVVGSLASQPGSSDIDAHADDARLATAIAIAAREVLLPGMAARHAQLLGPALSAIQHEKNGIGLWDKVFCPLVSEFAVNARSRGVHRRTAAMRALAAAVHLKGLALSGSGGDDVFLLGSAAASMLRSRVGVAEVVDEPSLKKLAQDVAAFNDVRTGIWDENDSETSRLLGAAAAVAVFGRGSITKLKPSLNHGENGHTHLSFEKFGRYAHLTASAAAEVLDDEATHPRTHADERSRLATLADFLRHHPAVHAVSFSEALGINDAEERREDFSPGMKVYRAVMAGRRRPIICEGKNGRKVRCRAVASPSGAFVGYLAFDALSRELGGRPIYAAYTLNGDRYGYAWADEHPVIRRGEPEQGFKTALERIQV